MKSFNKILVSLSFLIIGMIVFSCQDFDRPDMVIIPDPEEIPYDPMKIFIPFDDNSPTDKSIYAFTTTPTGLEYVEGVSGTAMQGADGRYLLIGKPDERPDVMDTLKNMGSFTTAFWINIPEDAAGGAQMIFSMPNSEKGWGNLDIFTDGANENGLTLKTHLWNYRTGSAAETWQTVSLPNATGKWTHVAIRYDGKTSKFTLFQNKAQVYEATIADFGALTFDKAAGSFVIGTFGKLTNPPLTSDPEKWDWAKSFQGKIDQFRLYNKALSDSEIGAIYGSEAPGGFGETFYMPFDGDYVDKISSLAATAVGTPGFDDAGKNSRTYRYQLGRLQHPVHWFGRALFYRMGTSIGSQPD